MKKLLLIIWMIALLILIGGCAKEEKQEEIAVPTAQIAYAAYQYDEGYQLSEGWMYEMTISAEAQLEALNGLVDGMKLTIRDELFGHGRGYHLELREADGQVSREILILEDGSVSMEGMMYEADGSEALLAWLDALQIEEQNVE